MEESERFMKLKLQNDGYNLFGLPSWPVTYPIRIKIVISMRWRISTEEYRLSQQQGLRA